MENRKKRAWTGEKLESRGSRDLIPARIKRGTGSTTTGKQGGRWSFHLSIETHKKMFLFVLRLLLRPWFHRQPWHYKSTLLRQDLILLMEMDDPLSPSLLLILSSSSPVSCSLTFNTNPRLSSCLSLLSFSRLECANTHCRRPATLWILLHTIALSSRENIPIFALRHLGW